MSRRGGWPEFIASMVSSTFLCGLLGAITTGIWTGALGFGFGVGALWGGVGLAVVGVLLGFIVGAGGRAREGIRGIGLIMAPLVGLSVIGGIVWIVRALL